MFRKKGVKARPTALVKKKAISHQLLRKDLISTDFKKKPKSLNSTGHVAPLKPNLNESS